MLILLAVGAGGALGAVARYLVSGWVHRMLPEAAFPWGTLAVNVAGCLIIGLLGGLIETRQVVGPEGRAFLMIGVLGGLTTFSSFGYETFMLARDGEFLRVAANVLLHFTVVLGAVWAGWALAVRLGGA